MKNIKGLLLATMTMLFLGVGNSYAQEKSTVIIKGQSIGDYFIEIIKPDYEVEQRRYKLRDPNFKELNFDVLMKKEVDYWLNQGYELKDVTSSTTGLDSNHQTLFFVLIKED